MRRVCAGEGRSECVNLEDIAFGELVEGLGT
jgi:hypothetical protein